MFKFKEVMFHVGMVLSEVVHLTCKVQVYTELAFTCRYCLTIQARSMWNLIKRENAPNSILTDIGVCSTLFFNFGFDFESLRFLFSFVSNSLP